MLVRIPWHAPISPSTPPLPASPHLPQVAKLRVAPKSSVRYDTELGAFVLRLPNRGGGGSGSGGWSSSSSGDSSGGGEEGESLVHPAVMRRSDTSAASINEWTGQRTLR